MCEDGREDNLGFGFLLGGLGFGLGGDSGEGVQKSLECTQVQEEHVRKQSPLMFFLIYLMASRAG